MKLKHAGYLLITISFLGGSLEVVKQVEGVNTAVFLLWLGIGITGRSTSTICVIGSMRGFPRTSRRSWTRVRAWRIASG